MNENPPSLFEAVLDGLDRERTESAQWEGSFKEYLELVESDPLIARNAWQRLLDMIEAHGSQPPAERGGAKRWNLFDDPFDVQGHEIRESVFVDPDGLEHDRPPAQARARSVFAHAGWRALHLLVGGRR